MRRGKRALRAIAGSAIAALAVASAITTVQTVAPEGGATAYGAQAPRPTQPAGAERAFAAMPLAFVQNQGQTDARVRYYALGNRYAFFATRDELMLSLTRGQAGSAARAGAPLRRPQTANASADRGQAGAGQRSTTCAAVIRPGGRRSSRATATSSTAISGRASTCGCTSSAGVAEVRVPRAARRRVSPTSASPTPAPTASRSTTPGRAADLDRPRRPARLGAGVATRRSPACACRSRAATCSTRGGKAPRFAFAVGGYQRDHELVIDPGVQYTTFLGGNSTRDRRRHRGRRHRQRLRRRHDAVARLPDHDRRVQAHRRGAATSPTSSSRS